MTSYPGLVRRYAPLIALVALLSAAGTAAYLAQRAHRYQATAYVQIYNLSSPLQTSGGQSDLTRAMLTQIAVVHGDAVRDAVRTSIGSAPGVKVEPAGDADVLAMTATARSGGRAATVADAYADAYVEVGRVRAQQWTDQLAGLLTTREQRLQQQIDAIDTKLHGKPDSGLSAQRRLLAGQLASLLNSSGDVAVRSAANSLQATVIRRARPPRHPSGPSPALPATGASLVGALLGFAVACLIDAARRDRPAAGEEPAGVAGLSALEGADVKEIRLAAGGSRE